MLKSVWFPETPSSGLAPFCEDGVTNSTLDILEHSKRDELASRLRRDGFVVDELEAGEFFDLTATKNGERIAFQVRARPRLAGSRHQLRQLREKAREQGFTEFRLVVVQPPRQVQAGVEGLDRKLLEYLSAAPLPSELLALSTPCRLLRVAHVELDSLDVLGAGISAAGTAVLEVEFGAHEDTASFKTDFPMTFEVTLSHKLEVHEVHSLQVDTSSYSD
jgi:hypothetical protein